MILVRNKRNINLKEGRKLKTEFSQNTEKGGLRTN